ncbi:hypothetical protein [Rossellomorea marisflavi]|uniref:hypothetical protein n=1 Tax=Rossellomorea marisflavi TaxID=189381 RepID=UPI003FA0E1C6
MIFEISYENIQKPLSLLKSLISDKDYKSETKSITLECKDKEVKIFFKDKRLNTEMTFTLEDATMLMDGCVTCSFASFFEIVKVFKKSKEPLIVEQDQKLLLVGDGQYPEEILTLSDYVEPHEPVVGELWTSADTSHLVSGLELASTLLKKTTIPEEELNTQGIYISTSGKECSLNTFSVYGFHRSSFQSVNHMDKTICLPKTIASSLLKVVKTMKKEWELIFSIVPEELVEEDEEEYLKPSGILIQTADGKSEMFFALDVGIENGKHGDVFKELTQNIKDEVNKETTLEVKVDGLKLISKVKANDNLSFEDGKVLVTPSGFQATTVKKLVDKGAVDSDGKLYILNNDSREDKILLMMSNDNGQDKITTISYRLPPTA